MTCFCVPTDEMKRLLVVEDNAAQSEMLRDYFSGMAVFSVDIAATVEEAMATFEPGKYFAAILDLHLGTSVEQGMDLAVHFRHNDSSIYLAAISGYGPQLDRRLVGVVDVLLVKPVNYGLLQNKLIMWLIEANRRMEIKQYADTKIEQHDKKIMAYTETIARICAEHAEISEELAHLEKLISGDRDG